MAQRSGKGDDTKQSYIQFLILNLYLLRNTIFNAESLALSITKITSDMLMIFFFVITPNKSLFALRPT